MKARIRWTTTIILLVSAGLLILKTSDVTDTEMVFTSNEDLQSRYTPRGWKGTPKSEGGQFQNLYQPFRSNWWDVLKWKLSDNPLRKQKTEDHRLLEVVSAEALVGSGGDYLIWLGHATFLMQRQGKTLLIDPILIDNFFLKRQSELPLPIENLPEIDYILVSHNHRDHCDKKTISFLAERNPEAVFLVGLGMSEIISPWLQGQVVQEAGWFQQYSLDVPDMEITYVPSRHWSRRGLFDENSSLWGGYFFRFADVTTYFMGDSGYGPHFQDIRDALGSPDYCLAGVGAYKPEWFMESSHISPHEAIKVFQEMGASYLFPMHFGTFDLSDEPLLYPLDVLLEEAPHIHGQLIFPVIGKNIW